MFGIYDNKNNICRCPNCGGWPIKVGCHHEAIKCANCDDVVEYDAIEKYFKTKMDFINDENLNSEYSYRHLTSLHSICHPYDLCFIAAAQITLQLCISADQISESQEVASMLHEIIKQLAPSSPAFNEIKMIIMCFKNLKDQ